MKSITFVFFSFLSISVFAQTNNIKNLVFEGAGVRGIAYAGAIASLEEEAILPSIEKIGGTSAGAITALLLSAGYSSTEIAEVISETKIQKFNDGRYFFVGGFNRVYQSFGWYRGEKLKSWLQELLEEKGIDGNITFQEYYESTKADIYLTASCLNQQKMIVLSRQSYPKMKVVDAVRISMSIPIYYQAVFVDSIGNCYSKQNESNTLDIMVDGGIIGNFPIDIFDLKTADKRIPNFETIGFRIDSDAQIANDQENQALATYPIQNFSDYITAFYSMVIENLNRNQLDAADWKRTVSISSKGIGPKVKKLSQEEKTRLIEAGKTATHNYLNSL